MVDGLAAARLARIVRVDDVGAPLRNTWTRAVYWAAGREQSSPMRMAGPFPGSLVDPGRPAAARLVDCGWCVTVWCAAAALIARRWFPNLWATLGTGLAAAQVAGMADAAAERLSSLEPLAEYSPLS